MSGYHQDKMGESHYEWASRTTVGEQIAEARRALGLSQNKLGEMAGVAGGYLSKIERSLVMPNGNLLIRISSALGTPLVFSPEQVEVRYRAMDKVKAPYSCWREHRSRRRRTVKLPGSTRRM